MFTDARTLAPDSVVDADVAVIGSGPAGIALAMALGDRGHRVVLVESGGREPDAVTRRLSRGESVGTPYFRLDECRVRGFGGTSGHWFENTWFRARPLDPIDFEDRPGLRGGWPFDHSELLAYYTRASELCRLGPLDYRAEQWEGGQRRQLPLDRTVVETSVFQLSPADTWVRRFDDLVQNPSVELLLHATVVEIAMQRGSDRVAALQARTLEGTSLEIRAEHFVVAAGGIENARLLLLHSRSAGALGDLRRRDVVGRYFMEHLGARSGTWHPSDPSVIETLDLYRPHQPSEDPLRVQAKLALTPETLRAEGILNGVFVLLPMSSVRAAPATRSFLTLASIPRRRPLPRNLGAHARVVATNPGVVAATATDRLRRHRLVPTVVKLQAMVEQAPRYESRVLLGRRRDRFGMPVARLDWRLSDIDRLSIRRAQEILDEQVRAAGLGYLSDMLDDTSPATPIEPQWHLMGTTRMDPDPASGVVDEHCRVHGIENLHVAGSSVFPSGGYANPTLTIVALALRLADRLHWHLA